MSVMIQRDGKVAEPAREGYRAEMLEKPTEVRTGCIGRGHAGKTALFRALGEGPVGDFFPSGLHVDVGDPREVAQMIRESEETKRILQASGLPPTLEAAQIRYYLYEGDEQRVQFSMKEVIGQVLTHTLPDSSREQQARYDEYLKTLVNTHVLWAVIPCLPPNPSAIDRRRYSNDLRITGAYLREALRMRNMAQPASVALVLSKIDTLFSDEHEARAALTDDALRNALGPLIHLVNHSNHVADAVVIPVTAFGFGNAVLRRETPQNEAPAAPDDPLDAEPIWLLRDGTPPQPSNLDTLVLWSLLFGLANQGTGDATGCDGVEGNLCELLRQDLLDGSHWLLPLKGRLVKS